MDELLNNMYIKSNEKKRHEMSMTYSLSIIQYIFTPIIADVLYFAFKKLILIENAIIELIHKKKISFKLYCKRNGKRLRC